MPAARKSIHETPAAATVAKATHPNTKDKGETTMRAAPKKSKSTKHVTSETPAPAIVADATHPATPEGDTPTMSTVAKQSTPTTPAEATVAKATNPIPSSIAKSAATGLRLLEPGLHLEDALSPEDKVAAGSLARIHEDAILIGIDVAERHPDRFPDFDIDKNRYAVEYAQSMGAIAQQYRDTAARIEETILALHADATRQTLALYAGMKALSRVPSGQSMLPQIRQMKLLVRTRVRRRATGDDAATTSTNGAPASSASSSPSAPAPAAVAHPASASASPPPASAVGSASPPPTNGATVTPTVLP